MSTYRKRYGMYLLRYVEITKDRKGSRLVLSQNIICQISTNVKGQPMDMSKLSEKDALRQAVLLRTDSSTGQGIRNEKHPQICNSVGGASLPYGLAFRRWAHGRWQHQSQEWLDAFSQAVLLSDPTTSLLVLAVSWSVLGILFFLVRSKRKARSLFSVSRPLGTSRRKTQASRPQPHPDRPTPTKDRVEVAQEWRRLDEADKEIIREIVSQKGLWETDIIALLQARGFLHPSSSRFDSVAERASFVHCDFAGYHSIPPEYQAPLASVLASDSSEGYQ